MCIQTLYTCSLSSARQEANNNKSWH